MNEGGIEEAEERRREGESSSEILWTGSLSGEAQFDLASVVLSVPYMDPDSTLSDLSLLILPKFTGEGPAARLVMHRSILVLVDLHVQW